MVEKGVISRDKHHQVLQRSGGSMGIGSHEEAGTETGGGDEAGAQKTSGS